MWGRIDAQTADDSTICREGLETKTITFGEYAVAMLGADSRLGSRVHR